MLSADGLAWGAVVLASCFIVQLAIGESQYFNGVFFDGLTKKGTPIARLTAYNIVGTVACSYLSLVGVRTFIWGDLSGILSQNDPEQFIYGSAADANILVATSTGYQMYNFIVSTTMTETRTPIGLVHHAATAMLGLWMLLDGPIVQFYGAYFVGVGEISSIPLGIVDMFKYNTGLQQRFPSTNAIFRVAFALSFIVVRCITWPLVTCHFISNAFVILQNAHARNYMQLVVFVVCNAGFCILQVYWGFAVVNQVKKVLSRQQPAAKQN